MKPTGHKNENDTRKGGGNQILTKDLFISPDLSYYKQDLGSISLLRIV